MLVKHPSQIRDLGPYLRRTIVNLATDQRRRAARGNAVLQRLDHTPGDADADPSDLEDQRASHTWMGLAGQVTPDGALALGEPMTLTRGARSESRPPICMPETHCAECRSDAARRRSAKHDPSPFRCTRTVRSSTRPVCSTAIRAWRSR